MDTWSTRKNEKKRYKLKSTKNAQKTESNKQYANEVMKNIACETKNEVAETELTLNTFFIWFFIIFFFNTKRLLTNAIDPPLRHTRKLIAFYYNFQA